jgi:hypothetical protein
MGSGLCSGFRSKRQNLSHNSVQMNYFTGPAFSRGQIVLDN